MSPETPNVYQTSLLRKSLAAVSRLGHPNSAHAPAHAPAADVPMTRRPSIKAHRIFNLHLSRSKISTSPRLGSKVGGSISKSTNLGSLVDVDGSTSLDEDDSVYNEDDSNLSRPPFEREDDPSYLGPDESLESDYNAINPASPQTPPGLKRPPRYPIIIPTRRNEVPRPGIVPPKHWAPGGGCNVRIEPEPAMHFLPRPGTIPPSYWAPGGRAARIETPERDVFHKPELHQDDTDGTMSNSISGASGIDSGEERNQDIPDSSLNEKDLIHAQLEYIYNMDDADFDEALLPGIRQSVWATCPTPPPSPNRLRSRLSRKESHALLNYLLLECGYDLGSLRSLEARFPVPIRYPEDAQLEEGCARDLIDFDLPISNQDAPELSTEDTERWDLLQTQHDSPSPPIRGSKALEAPNCEYVDQVQSCVLDLGTSRSVERTSDPQVYETHTYEPVVVKGEGVTALQPSVIDHSTVSYAMALLAHSNFLVVPDSQITSRSSYPLRRTLSLPMEWSISKFTVFDEAPPSPPPAPKPKTKKLYLQTAAISSVESLAAPLQSGRAYLRSILPKKIKTKTRPDTACVGPMADIPLTRTSTGNTMKKPTLMSRLCNRGTDNDEPKATLKPKPAGKWFGKLSKMSRATADRMRVLVKCAPNARELTWKDFLKIMKELGFRWEEMEGTAFKFYPADPTDPAITLHRPHDKVYHVRRLNIIRKQLVETYGWVPEDFLAALGAEK
ncbi:hypothetical protein B0H15DRAFT_858966 [Mycena belliarum]|uniref:Uncharacterized protein n=1 Tax=Mycena belliarum TaxID=1033014 RepID=A0AAD6XPN2_9AGAR|nr:hypothetical protein B0H15DRAFT_858966 [Mycena belliae]